MHYIITLGISIIIASALIGIFIASALIGNFQIKKLKEKTLKVIEGKIENKQLNKLISRARTYSKNRFVIYMCFQRLLFITSVAIFIIVMDLNKSNEPYFRKYILPLLLLILIVDSIFIVIAKANTIWQQVDNMGKE